MMIFVLAFKSLIRVIPAKSIKDYFVGFWSNLKRRAITSFSFILFVCMVLTGIGCILVIGMRHKHGLQSPLNDYTTISMFFVPLVNFVAYVTDVPVLHFTVSTSNAIQLARSLAHVCRLLIGDLVILQACGTFYYLFPGAVDDALDVSNENSKIGYALLLGPTVCRVDMQHSRFNKARAIHQRSCSMQRFCHSCRMLKQEETFQASGDVCITRFAPFPY
jgi:hypothetical protein